MKSQETLSKIMELLNLQDEVNKAKNVLSNLKQMKMAFRDMSKNGKAAVSALKAI